MPGPFPSSCHLPRCYPLGCFCYALMHSRYMVQIGDGQALAWTIVQNSGVDNWLLSRELGILLCLTRAGILSTLQCLEGVSEFANYCICHLVAVTWVPLILGIPIPLITSSSTCTEILWYATASSPGCSPSPRKLCCKSKWVQGV